MPDNKPTMPAAVINAKMRIFVSLIILVPIVIHVIRNCQESSGDEQYNNMSIDFLTTQNIEAYADNDASKKPNIA
jgi:hypothetical protein